MGKENLKRRNPTPNKPSGSGGNNAPPVRKVRPVSTPEDIGREIPAPDGVPSNGTLIGKARDTMSAVGNSVGGALKNGFMGLKNNWFGVKPIKNATSSGVDSISNFLNLPKKVVTGILVTTLFGGGVAGGIAYMNHNSNEFLIRQEDYLDDCAEILADAKKTLASVDDVGDPNAEQLKLAEQMWAFGKAFGFTDEQCAGMLGNMTQESQIDPTTIEGYFNDAYQFSEWKAEKFDAGMNDQPEPNENMTAHTHSLFSQYANRGINISHSAYGYPNTGDSDLCCGIGLIQWTGPGAHDLIEIGASYTTPYPWYALETQCATLLKSPEWRHRLDQVLNDSANADSVEGAAASFLGYVEAGMGAPDTSESHAYSNRAQYAREWYARLSSRSSEIESQNQEFVTTVFDMAQTETGTATGNHMKKVDEKCGKVVPQSYDNSSLAGAAVAYAWETKDMGMGNDGTELFRIVHDAVMPGDPWYQSCDRGVSVAVRWSGADDTYPPGATDDQVAYLHEEQASAKWEDLGLYDDVKDELQPGDILLASGPQLHAAKPSHTMGHTLMYVGNDLIREKYPNSDAVFISASYKTRSPGCETGVTLDYHVGYGYHVYRYKGSYDGKLKDAYTGNASGTS